MLSRFADVDGRSASILEARVTCTAVCAVWVLSVSNINPSGLCSEYRVYAVLGYLTLIHWSSSDEHEMLLATCDLAEESVAAVFVFP